MKNLGLEYLKLGLLNQDALEIFFGCMRNHSGRFVKLNCYQADGVFKTLLINNLISYHSVGSNCLPDYGKGLFALQSLIFSIEKEIKEVNEGSFENDEPRHNQKRTTNRRHCFSFQINKKVALTFAKQLLSKHCPSDCAECQKTFFETVEGDVLTNTAMNYFERGFIQATSTCFRELPLMCF